ncbi:hypothetical protein K456DRAFT_34231 [Colletotrichum gloeosporioides 23]|nr:hypothetical protein K456DRAFT_34231 [Colletotrichum gloeosporioides 23]
MFQARCAYQASHNLLHLRPQWYSEVPNFRDQSDDVVEMLVRARQPEASDPRHKVFALLGISRDIELDDPRLTIDYNKRPARVYADFARFVIGTTESFDLLSHVNHFVYFFPCYFHPELSQSQSVPNFSSPYGWLPSWVPNWNGSESARGEEANRRKAGAKVIRSSLAWRTMVEGAYYPFDMKEILGCYDPECTMDNVQPSGFLGPTILSTLPEETVEAQAYRRIIARANMRWAGIENMRFDVIGSYIGHVKWRCFLVQKQNGNWTNAQMDPDMPGVLKWPHIDWCLLDDNPDLGAEAIESHLFARGKQTAVWSSNAGDHFVYDKSSAIDGKRIGTFGNLLKYGKILSRVILPPAACVGDFIVSFHGGRVPFVIRRTAEPSRYTSEDLTASQAFGSVPGHTENSAFGEGMPFERCKFVGECLINDFEHWNDCIKDQKVMIFGIH